MKEATIRHFGRSALCRAGISPALALLIACHKGDFEPIQRQQRHTVEPAQARYELGQKVSFRAGGNSESFRVSGWSITEQDHTWTEGDTATLRFNGIPMGVPLRLDVVVSGGITSSAHARQVAQVYANGEAIARWEFAEHMADVTAEIPPLREGSGGTLTVEFRVLYPVSPASIGTGSDTRRLGLSFVELLIVQA